MEEGNEKTTDDVSVLEKIKGDQGVWGVSFFVHCETDHETCAKYQEDYTVGCT